MDIETLSLAKSYTREYVDEHGGGAGLTKAIAWDGESTPDVTQIPQGVTVTYQGTTYTGTMSPSGKGSYLIFVRNTEGTTPNIYDEYVTVGETPVWEKIGSTQIVMTDYEKKLTVKTSLDATLVEHCLYNLGSISSLALVLPTTASRVGEAILVCFTSSASFTPTASGGDTEGESLYATTSGKKMQLMFEWNGEKWLLQTLEY